MYRLTEGERTLLQQAMYWKERAVMERNNIIFKKKPTADQVKHLNETVGNIVQFKEEWSLQEIDCLLYAAQIDLAGQNNQNTSRKVLTGRRKKSESLDNPNAKEILNLRKWIAWIANILEMRNRGKKLTEKQKNNLHRIKRKYRTSKTSKLKEIKEKLYQRVNILSSREKKAKLTKHFRKENEEFDKSPKGWLEKVTTENSRGQENQKIPDMNEFEMFWGKIWKKPYSIDREKWSEFMNIMSFHVKVES